MALLSSAGLRASHIPSGFIAGSQSGESCPIPIPPIPIHGVMAKSTAQLVVTAWLSCSRQRGGNCPCVTAG